MLFNLYCLNRLISVDTFFSNKQSRSLIMKKMKIKGKYFFFNKMNILNKKFLELLVYKNVGLKFRPLNRFFYNKFFFYKKKIYYKFYNFFKKINLKIHFNLKSNNIFCYIKNFNSILFWNSSKLCFRSSKSFNKFYSRGSIIFLCESILIFLKKNKYKKSLLNFSLFLEGLIKFRWFIINFYLKTEKIYFSKIVDLSLLPHNGVRQKKKRRLAKRKRRKVFFLINEGLKTKLFKKKKLNCYFINFKSNDLFYIYDFFFKFLKLYFFSFKFLFFFKNKNETFDVLRSVHVFSKSRDKFYLYIYSLFFYFLFLKSSYFRKFLLTWLRCLNFSLFLGSYKIVARHTSFKF